ncbi:hypothetical protein PCASD_05455 [Puccinia coronata f. sp. avenae]|uniref:Auxin efflux carrier n=1 Tax=Puccinia coronata f. sp. avenae TaxID=200324 RepID=A0A2N5V8V2_9BASI|nr:hypothetical protein PCASD_05455 [Puccinia coronata f. sp. avenae]
MDLNIAAVICTVAESILQIATFCLIGYIAARRGILDVKVRRQMSRVNVAVFTPALMFSKVAFSLTPQMLAQLWVIPVGYLALSGVSAGIAWGLGKCFGLSKIRRNLAVAGATFMNSNTLPIALMQTMSSSLSLKWKADDTRAKALDRSFQYLVLCAVLGALLRWSVGITLLNSSDEPAGEAQAKQVSIKAKPASAAEGNVDEAGSHHPHEPISRPETLVVSPFHRDSKYLVPPTPLTAVSMYDLQAPTPSTAGNQSEFQKDILGIENETELLSSKKRNTRKMNLISKSRRALCCKMGNLKTRLSIPKKTIEALDELLNPPLVSSIAAIIVACIAPLQSGLAKIKPLREFISTAGAVAIPLTLVLLGAFFYRAPKGSQPQTEDERTESRKEKRRESRKKLIDIALTLSVRHIITPLIMLPILAVICQHSKDAVFHDPVFILSATLIIGAPPAITLAQMTAKANLDFFDEMVSKLLLWSYSLATPITTVFLVLGAMLIHNSTV